MSVKLRIERGIKTFDEGNPKSCFAVWKTCNPAEGEVVCCYFLNHIETEGISKCKMILSEVLILELKIIQVAVLV